LHKKRSFAPQNSLYSSGFAAHLRWMPAFAGMIEMGCIINDSECGLFKDDGILFSGHQ
jgi:hypothetical protein